MCIRVQGSGTLPFEKMQLTSFYMWRGKMHMLKGSSTLFYKKTKWGHQKDLGKNIKVLVNCHPK
jgi:hypothetical protein